MPRPTILIAVVLLLGACSSSPSASGSAEVLGATATPSVEPSASVAVEASSSTAPSTAPSAPPSSGPRLATAVKADKSCAVESTTKSKSATHKSTYTITNGTASILSVYWLNYSGHRELWFTVPPDRRVEQATYKSHPWVVTDEAGRCLRLFYAPITITVK